MKIKKKNGTKSDALVTRYMKVVRAALSLVGAWPEGAIQGTTNYCQILHSCCLILQTALVITGQVIYIAIHWRTLSFIMLGQLVVTIFLAMISLARSVILALKGYGKIIQIFLREFRLTNFKHQGGFFRSVGDRVEYLSAIFTGVMLVMMFFGASGFNVVPVYLNLRNEKNTKEFHNDTRYIEYSLYYTFPGVNPQAHYKITTSINTYLSFVCGLLVSGVDLFLSLIVFQIIAHIIVLKSNLENIPRPESEDAFQASGIIEKESVKRHIQKMVKYSEEENKMIHSKLVENVVHHLFIVKFTDDVSTFFGPMLGINYMFHASSCCLLLLQCSQMDFDAILRYGPLTAVVFTQLVQISTIFEVVHTQSEKLKDSVYNLPWECMDIRNQRSVFILLNRVQRPIQVRAMGMATVGVQVMVSILKATFSYFTFLRTMTFT